MSIKLPQNLKFKKFHKTFIYAKGSEQRVCGLFTGSSCGLVALEAGRLTREQLMVCFQVIQNTLKGKMKKKQKKNRVVCSVAIRAPLTSKSLGSRMGRGKGNVDRWICHVKPGRMLFQIQHVRRVRIAFLALHKISYKLPILTKIVLKHPLFFSRYLRTIK
jgi:large subunit ribosomal protein L16